MIGFLGFLRTAWPYLLAASVGFSGAWWVQGIRVDAAKRDAGEIRQQCDDYKTTQRVKAINDAEAAEKRREQTIREWSDKYAKLQNDADIYQRCVAAGKCGVRQLPAVFGGVGLKLSATIGTDAASANPVPAAREGTADFPEVLKDCAVTTLMLNTLQTDIENQTRK